MRVRDDDDVQRIRRVYYIGDDRIREGKSPTKRTRRERFAFLLYIEKNVVIDALYRVQYP